MAEIGTDTLQPAAPPRVEPSALARTGSAPAITGQTGGTVHTGQVLPPKKKRRGFIVPLVVLAALGAGGWKGYDYFTTGRFLVSTDDAYVKADMSIIAAKIAGYITAVPVLDNTAVKAGDVLARIDDGDYRNALDAAKARAATQDASIARADQQAKAQHATIDQMQAIVPSAQADALRAAAEFERNQKLMASSYGTPQKMEQAQADRDRTVASVKGATAGLAQAQAALGVLVAQRQELVQQRAEIQTTIDKAERDLSFTVIRAPFDGIVGNRAVQTGQYVQPGTRLLALVPPESAYVEANFKETQLAALKPGQKVSIKLDAYAKREIEGTVQSFAPASGSQFSLLPPDNATGNFTKIVQRLPVRIAVPAEVAREGVLRPGLSVEVEVHTRDPSQPKPSLARLFNFDALGFTREARN